MKWFRRNFLWTAFGLCATSASAQEFRIPPASNVYPSSPPSISLGLPKPISASNGEPGQVHVGGMRSFSGPATAPAYTQVPTLTSEQNSTPRPVVPAQSVTPAWTVGTSTASPLQQTNFAQTGNGNSFVVVRAARESVDDEPAKSSQYLITDGKAKSPARLPADLNATGKDEGKVKVLRTGPESVVEFGRPAGGAPQALNNPWTGKAIASKDGVMPTTFVKDGEVYVVSGSPGVAVENAPSVLCDSDICASPVGYDCCQRFTFSAEYLFWGTKGFYIPPLVSTDLATVPQVDGNGNTLQGVIGRSPTAKLLYGDQTIQGATHSGARFTVAYTFDPCCEWTAEASFFYLGRRGETFDSSLPVLARPFTRFPNIPDAELISTPGITPNDLASLCGRATVDSLSSLNGVEGNLKRKCWSECDRTAYGLVGFRYLALDDSLHIAENITSFRAVPGTTLFDPGTTIRVTDFFDTRNRFYGPQVGASMERTRGRWIFSGQAKVGLGVTVSEIDIIGQQVFTPVGGNPQVFNGGLLALASNSGTRTKSSFSVVPEVAFKVGYSVTDNLRVFVGYDFLYWSNVMRPGDQIDTVLDVNQIPNPGGPRVGPVSNPPRPQVPFRRTDYWAQGLTGGLEWRY